MVTGLPFPENIKKLYTNKLTVPEKADDFAIDGCQIRHAKAQTEIVCAPKIAFIPLPINLNMCFGCSKESSH